MFFGILFLALGVAVLLNALGIFGSASWGIFWGIFFIAVGIRMMIKGSNCPMCGWGKGHNKIHEKMNGSCCGHNHEEE